MRHMPFGVRRIARETAAEMIVNAALAQSVQQAPHRIARRGVAAAKIFVPQEAEDRRVGKFRRAADPAIDGIELARQQVRNARQIAGRKIGTRLGLGHGGEMVEQLSALRHQRRALFAPGVVHRVENLGEGRASPTGLRRPVGAPEHRRALGGQKHRQRPSALLAHRVKRRHVDVIDVRPLLSVDFHIDEQPVHQPGGFRVLEGFMGHHMAPMAGGVADRNEDRAIAFARLRQRRRAPGAPVHGISGVLPQIGRRRLVEEVGRGKHGPF